MDNKALYEYKSLTCDPSFRLTAERLVMRCGVRADLKGFECLTDAVILFGTDSITSYCAIYRAVGALRGLKQKSVMREISYAIAQAFDLPARLSKMVGFPISPSDIHNALVIAYLGKLFKNPDLSLYA